jgi:predicted Rossmann-fold nucleotide-binding protein
MGELRNGLIVRASDALVAVGGGHGTLSEVAFALKLGRTVVGLGTWAVHGVDEVTTADAAIERIARVLAR